MRGLPLAGKLAVVPVTRDEALGEVVARRLAAEGATVVLVAGPGSAAMAGRIASDVEAGGGGRPAVFALDPARPDDLDALVEFVAELFG